MSKQFKIIMGFWSFVDVLLLAAAVASIVFSIVERKPDLMTNIALSTEHLNAGLIMGVVLLASWIVSIIAVLSPTASVTGFVLLNWMLVLDVLAILVVGTSLWYFTLHIEDNYLAAWQSLSNATKIQVQDKFSCCGYFMPNDSTAAIGGFCANQTFINSLFNATSTTENACITDLTGFGEPMLNQVFTLPVPRVALCHPHETREGTLPEDRRQAWRRRLRLNRAASSSASASAAQRCEHAKPVLASPPVSTPDSLLFISARFRSRRRLPGLIKLHPHRLYWYWPPIRPLELLVAIGFVLFLLCVTSRLPPFPLTVLRRPVSPSALAPFGSFLPYTFHCLLPPSLRYRYNGISSGQTRTLEDIFLRVLTWVCRAAVRDSRI